MITKGIINQVYIYLYLEMWQLGNIPSTGTTNFVTVIKTIVCKEETLGKNLPFFGTQEVLVNISSFS